MSDSAYTERARLVAHLAAGYPSVLVYGADPDEPDWPVVFVILPTGQVSWHVAPDDIPLFEHVDVEHAVMATAPKWDGHSTDEKYQRLADHAALLANPPRVTRRSSTLAHPLGHESWGADAGQ